MGDYASTSMIFFASGLLYTFASASILRYRLGGSFDHQRPGQFSACRMIPRGETLGCAYEMPLTMSFG